MSYRLLDLHRSTALIRAAITIVLISGTCLPAIADDWPQILGPDRNGQSRQEPPRPWQGALEIEWNYDCGAGYAGVSVVGDRLFVWHREGDQELLDCVRTSDGTRIWRQNYDAYYRGGVDPDIGPRSVPVAVGDTVIAHGAGGDLHAVSISDGKKRWSRTLRADYDGDDGYFGAGSTPLVITKKELTGADATKASNSVAHGTDAVDGIVVTEVGGRSGAGLVAVDLSTGKTRWKSLSSEAAYASPVKLNISGVLRIAALMRLSLAIVDPSTGQVLQEIPFGKRGPTVNAATPLVEGQQVFLTASYGIGCKMLQVNSDDYKSLWKNDAVVSSQYVTPVKVGDFLYAVTGREDMGIPGLCCVDWRTGNQQWLKSNYGTAHLIALGNNILAQNVDGQLDLIAADPQALKVLATSPLPAGTYRSLPALADGVLYCRRSQSPKSSQIIAIKLPSSE